MKRLWQRLTVYDKILLLFLIIISSVFIIFPAANIFNFDKAGEKVIIIQSLVSGYQEIPLKDTYGVPIIVEAEGPLGTSLIEAHNGQVRLKKAPAADPEKICEKTGWISREGPVIICVPNRISIWIESKKQPELDGVTW